MTQKLMILFALTLGMACLAKAEKSVIAFTNVNTPEQEHMSAMVKCGTETGNSTGVAVLVQRDLRNRDINLQVTQIRSNEKTRRQFQVRSVENERLGGVSFQGSMLDLVINWKTHDDAVGVPAVLKVGENSVKLRCMKIQTGAST